MKIKSYLHINYATRFKKRFVQSYLYNLSKVRGHVLMLCGPALHEHISDALTILKSSSICSIYEHHLPTYLQNIKDLPNYKGTRNIQVYYDDIENAKVRRFTDLDLCRSLKSSLDIVTIVFNKMLKFKKKFNKHILVTFSGRSNRINDINTLCSVFNITNSFKRDTSIPGIVKYNHTEVNATYIIYRDGMPMVTFSYQFN